MDDPLEHAKAILSTTPERWRALVGTVPMDLMARRPAPGQWSALECLRHLVATERYAFPVRVDAFLSGHDLEAYEPEAAGATAATDEPEDLVATFERLRAQSLQKLQSVTPDDLRRSAKHPELGVVTLGEMLHEWAGHDLMHTVQGERALMQPFIPGSGAWRRYFADHEVTAPDAG